MAAAVYNWTMRLVGRIPFKSLRTEDISGIELPDFTVITGRNGAGKSNLLEALSSSAVYIEELGQIQGPAVRLFSLGQLLAAAEGPAQGAQFRDGFANAFNALQGWKPNVFQSTGSEDLDIQDSWLEEQLVSSGMMTRLAVQRLREGSGKRLAELDTADFRLHAPLLAGVRDPFTTSIAEIFLSYATRRWTNSVQQYRDSQTGSSEALSDEDFTALYGQPPWELLNETLRIVKLPYRFIAPPADVENVDFQARLSRPGSSPIGPGELSSGERVLLAVAMSLFTGTNMIDAIQLPQLLLLDEADASLHPSMVKSLLTVIEEIFVRQYKVKVIMTTHSPSTVALAPESTLFVMSDTPPRIRKTSTDEALRAVSFGLSSLSVKVENRRQVFVESEYDQSVFQELFALQRTSLATERSAEFIAVGKRDVGGGATAVKRLVGELRAAGVDTVYGIVDRDNHNGAPANIHYIADRYAIENLVFDPLVLGVFLLRDQVVSAEDLGLKPNTRAFAVDSTDAQTIIDAVVGKLGVAEQSKESVAYCGGFDALVPSGMLSMNGHELEELVTATFQPLKAHGKSLKLQVVRRAVGDRPDLFPKIAIDLFEKFD